MSAARPFSLAAIAGIVLILGGAYVLLEGAAWTSSREVLDVGGLRISAEERHPIRPWAGGAALLAGTILVVAGVRRPH